MEMVVRRFTFSAAHRLLHHEGDCRFLHGHNWVVEVGVRRTVSASLKEKDTSGMICDFGDLKVAIGSWIKNYLDHKTLLNHKDPLRFLNNPPHIFKGGAPFILTEDPTVEVIGSLLQEKFSDFASHLETELCFLKIYETENSSYEWRKE